MTVHVTSAALSYGADEVLAELFQDDLVGEQLGRLIVNELVLRDFRSYERLELEHDNFWAALTYARDASDPLAARLGVGLGWYFGIAERVSEGRAFIEAALGAARGRIAGRRRGLARGVRAGAGLRAPRRGGRRVARSPPGPRGVASALGPFIRPESLPISGRDDHRMRCDGDGPPVGDGKSGRAADRAIRDHEIGEGDAGEVASARAHERRSWRPIR